MTTIVNNPSPVTDSSGNGVLIGIILIIVFIVIASYFGIPALKRIGQPQINVAAPQVVIPDKIDVNVQQK